MSAKKQEGLPPKGPSQLIDHKSAIQFAWQFNQNSGKDTAQIWIPLDRKTSQMIDDK